MSLTATDNSQSAARPYLQAASCRHHTLRAPQVTVELFVEVTQCMPKVTNSMLCSGARVLYETLVPLAALLVYAEGSLACP
jgi:hypothetical protein